MPETDNRLCAYYELALKLCFATLCFKMFSAYAWIYVRFSGDAPSTLVWRVVAFAPTFLALLFFPIPRSGSASDAPASITRITMLAGLVFLVSLAVGALRSHALRYIAGDSFRFTVTWLTLYIAGVSAYSLAKAGRTARLIRILDWLAYLAIIDAAVTVVLAFRFPTHKISTMMSLFGVVWALFQDRRSRAFSGAVFVLCLFAFVLTGKRGNAIGLLLVIPFILWVQLRMPRTALANVLSVALVVALALMALLAKPSPYEDVVVSRFQRLRTSVSKILVERQSASYDSRVNEARNILAFYDSRPHLLLFGGGFGLEVRMKYHTGVSSRLGMMHNVHISWVAYFARNGILGVILLLATWRLAVLRPLFAYSRSANRNWIAMCLSLLLFLFALSFKGGMLMEDSLTPLIIGLLVGLMSVPEATAGPQGAARGAAPAGPSGESELGR